MHSNTGIALRTPYRRETQCLGISCLAASLLWYAWATLGCFIKPIIMSLVIGTLAPSSSPALFLFVLCCGCVDAVTRFSRWGFSPAVPVSRESRSRAAGSLAKARVILRSQKPSLADADDLAYFEAVGDIADNRHVLSMATIKHHRSSTLDHSLIVSQVSYYLAKAFGFDAVSTARGALLHDFFLYDWREKNHPHHPTEHPVHALRNARGMFALNAVEEDIIATHMWPVTRGFYACRESFLVSCVDKIATLWDLGPLFRGILFGK